MNNKTLQTIFSVTIAAFTTYVGMLAVPLLILLIMMVIDYISGMTAAWIRNELSSKIGAKGIVRKVGYMFLIVVAMVVDYLIYSGLVMINVNPNYEMFFGILVSVWLIINEMISILENLSKIGVPIPAFLEKIVKRLKISAERKGNWIWVLIL